jgi:hypothetical protein
MSEFQTYQTLNRLLTILNRSLPMYLTYASPWTRPGDERAVETLRRIVDDQQRLANRISEYVVDRYGPVELGEYPADFPDTHDLAFDYLLGKLVACQKRDVAALEACVGELHANREAAAMGEEALGAARAHLETLEELTAEMSKAGVSWAK